MKLDEAKDQRKWRL